MTLHAKNPYARRSALLAAAWLLVSCAAAQTNAVPGYDGKYNRDSRFKKKFARLDDYRTEALEQVAAKLGLSPGNADTIRIVVRDALPADAQKLVPYTAAPFKTRGASGGRVQIILHTEFIVNGMHDLRTEVIHEMAHAVMRERIPRGKYSALPKWLREGLAMWTAGQIEDRVVTILCGLDLLDGIGPAFPGLETGEHTLTRYAEDALAIEFIVKQAGDEAIHELTQLLVEGLAAHEAVARVTGTPWDAFSTAARDYALKRARELRPPEIDAYREVYELNRKRKYDEVIDASARFLKQHRRSPLYADTLYWRGKALRLRGKRGAAEKVLWKVVRRYPDRTTFVEEALYQLARARVDGKSYGRAIDPLKRLLRDHPESTRHDKALYYLALCRAKTGRSREAAELLDLLERSFADSEMKPKADELRTSLRR